MLLSLSFVTYISIPHHPVVFLSNHLVLKLMYLSFLLPISFFFSNLIQLPAHRSTAAPHHHRVCTYAFIDLLVVKPPPTIDGALIKAARFT